MKTTKPPLLSFLLLLLSFYWRVVEATPLKRKRQKQAALKIRWRWPMISSAHKKIPCLFSGTKRQLKPRLCIYKATMSLLTVWKRSSKRLLISHTHRIRLGWNCFRQQPLPSSKRQRWYSLQPKDWDVWVKSSRKKRCQVPKISSICGSKRGSNLLYFWPYNLSSRWYHQESWKKKAFRFKDVTTSCS